VGLIESSMTVEGNEEVWSEEVKENFIEKANLTVEQLTEMINEFLQFGQHYDEHGNDS
jgi:hypothetical protein